MNFSFPQDEKAMATAWAAAQEKPLANAFLLLSAIEARAIKSLVDSGHPQAATALADRAVVDRVSNVVRLYCALVSGSA